MKAVGFLKYYCLVGRVKFQLFFGSDGRIMLCKSRDEEFDPKCIVPIVKHRGGSVMVWGCFTKKEVGKLYILDRTMVRFYYRQILEENLLLGATLSLSFCFRKGKKRKAFAFLSFTKGKLTAFLAFLSKKERKGNLKSFTSL